MVGCLTLLTAGCDFDDAEVTYGTEKPLIELRDYQKAPKVKITDFRTHLDLSAQEKKDISQELQQQLQQVFNHLVNRKLNWLAQSVHPEDGLWVDLKAHRSYSKILAEIKNHQGYLHVYFLDTERLQAQSGDPDKIAVRDVLLRSQTIEAQVFQESSQQYELHLKLREAPDYSFYLNNPVFRKKDNQWYIYRMP